MGRLSQTTKRGICIFLFLLLIVCVGVCIYLIGKKYNISTHLVATSPSVSAATNSRQLNISAVRQSSHTSFSAEEMGENFTGKLSYYGVTNVTIDINGETIPLENALKNRQITSEELFHLARTDAANGFCTEFITSHLGLSRFFYSYPKFEVMLTYDVFETASGEQKLVNEVAVCSWNYHKKVEEDHMKSTITSPSSIYREDWGLKFKVTNATPTQIEFTSIQSAGHQLGELHIISYTVQTKEGKPINSNSDFSEFTPLVISSNSNSRHTITWSPQYSTLPSGTYELTLVIQDNYEVTQVHPLNKNFTDLQTYIINFEIP